jgi:hypothetical protein
MTNNEAADLLIGLGVAGIAQFGALKIAVRLGAGDESILGPRQRHRIDRCIRATPTAIALSLLLLTLGLVTRLIT